MRQERTFINFGPNTLILGAGLLGRKRGIFVLVADAITYDNSAMNTSAIIPDISELPWILGHPGEDLSVSALADRMAMSPRNFARLFHSETGDTPAQFADRALSDAARYKLEQSALPVETIAEQCGFGNTERMRRTFQRLFEVSPHDYRARFRSTLLN